MAAQFGQDSAIALLVSSMLPPGDDDDENAGHGDGDLRADDRSANNPPADFVVSAQTLSPFS